MHTRPDSRRKYAEVFLFPLRGNVLWSMLGLALFFLLAGAAGLLGLWLFLLTVTALMQYAFVIIRHSSLGHKEPPPLSIADFNPANTIQPIVLALLSIGVTMLATFAGEDQGLWASWLVLALWITALPAILATLAMEGSISRAFNPLIMFRIARTFGTSYLITVTIMFVALAIGLLLSAVGLPRYVEFTVRVYAFFLVAYSVGHLIYESRERIGHDVLDAPENREALLAARRLEEHKKLVDLAYQTARTDIDGAALLLKNYQAEQHLDIYTTQWVFDQLKNWDDHTTALRFAQSLIARRVALGQHHEALKNCLWCLSKNRRFRPQGPRDTATLGRAAIDSGQFRLGVLLLQDFAHRFPEDLETAPVLVLAAQTAAERLNDDGLATTLMAELNKLGVTTDDTRLAELRTTIDGSFSKGDGCT